MTQSWRNMAEHLWFMLGVLALVYAALISSELINRKDVSLMPGLQKKKTFIAVRTLEVGRPQAILHTLERQAEQSL